MTNLQKLEIIRAIVQFIFGAAVAIRGYRMMSRKWDRTQGEYLAGMVLFVLGIIIIFLLGVS